MRIDETPLAQAAIAYAILAAPGWARVGITEPNERLRQDAAAELARAILSNRRWEDSDPDQLILSL